MRRSLLLLPLAILPLVVLHCGSDDSTPAVSDDGGTLEDGGGATSDGTVGPIDSSQPTDSPSPTDTTMNDAPLGDVDASEAGNVDAGGDASPDAADGADAALPAVTVHIVAGATPLEGVVVFFSDSTGALLFTDTSDASGTVVETVPADSEVTALFETSAPTLVTLTGVQPGDELTADRGDSLMNPIEADVSTLPPDPPGATYFYSVDYGACSNGPFNTTAFPGAQTYYGGYFGCATDGVAPAMIYASDDQNHLLAFSYDKTVTVPDGGAPYPLPLAGASAWSTAVTTQTVTVTSFDGGAPAGSLLSFGEIATDVLLPQRAAVPASPPYSASFTGHTGYADAVQSELTMNGGTLYDAGSSSPGYSLTAVATRTSAPTADGGVSLDATQLLPYVTSANVDSTDVARPTITWAASGSLASTVAGVARGYYSVFPDGGFPIGVSWTIVVPSSATAARPPTLPAALAFYTPTTLSPLGDNGLNVVFFKGTGLTTYAQVRTASSAVLKGSPGLDDTDHPGPLVPPLPSDMTVEMTAFTNPN